MRTARRGAEDARAPLSGTRLRNAFDDARDFSRHDLLRLARARTLYRVPVWIDVGRSDPFMNADTTLAAELRAHGTRVQLVVHGGGHSGWAGRMPRYLRFYAEACAA